MKVLVTGSEGFLGKHLVNKLHNFTYCIDKKGNPALDITDPNIRIDTILDIDVIYHLASPCSNIEFIRDPVGSMMNALIGMQRVIFLARASGAKIVFPSSGNIYGKSTEFTEHTTPIPTNLYAVSKITMENMCDLSRIPYTAVRVFLGYGPGEEKKGDLSSVVYQFLHSMRQGKSPIVYGDGNQTRDFIYIEDVVDGLIQCSRTRTKIVNLGTGVSHSFKDLVKIINDVLGKNIEPTYIPKETGYVENARANTYNMDRILKIKKTSLVDGVSMFNEYLDKVKE